jgi:hypothetical protein
MRSAPLFGACVTSRTAGERAETHQNHGKPRPFLLYNPLKNQKREGRRARDT